MKIQNFTPEKITYLERVAVAFSMYDILSVRMDSKGALTIALRDPSDGYYTNNFEKEVLYYSEDDDRRFRTAKVSPSGIIETMHGAMVQQFHDFKSAEFLGDRIEGNYKILIENLKRI